MIDDEMMIPVGQWVPCTEAEGPGKRFALWFQGCPLRCPGCCNPEFLPFRGGQTHPLSMIVNEIDRARRDFGIEGITLLGGEPFAHAQAAARLASEARKRDLGVMVFSGYTLEAIRDSNQVHSLGLLSQTDLLVDGPYIREQADTIRRWIGSRNQQIHFLTARYSPDDPCWKQRNTLEIRVHGSEVSVNGFPAQQAVGLWKGWKRGAIRVENPVPPPESDNR